METLLPLISCRRKGCTCILFRKQAPRCSVFPIQSPKHNILNNTNTPIKVPIVHCVNVLNVQVSSKKVYLFSYKIMNHKHQGGLVMLPPADMPGGDSPSPTVLAVHLPHWPACAVSPWVEGTITTGYRLQFKVRPTSFPQCDINSCGEGGGNSIEGRNKQLVEQKSDISCSHFGCKQRMVQLLFGCSKERGRTPSYS